MSNTDTQDQILQIVQDLAALFPQRPVAVETITGYCAHLQDVPVEMLRVACHRLATRLDWFPSVAQIRTEVVAMAFRPPLPQEAWSEVLRQVSKVGHRGTPTFSLPVIDQVVKAIGWRTICLTDESEFHHVATRFDRTYTALVQRATNDALIDLRLVLPAGGTAVKRLTDQPDTVLLADRVAAWDRGEGRVAS